MFYISILRSQILEDQGVQARFDICKQLTCQDTVSYYVMNCLRCVVSLSVKVHLICLQLAVILY